MNPKSIAIFSDLDGCLLNKSDYSFEAAVPVLKRIRELHIPLVLASSKTEVEMRRIADAMQLQDAPLICENGGVVFRSRKSVGSDNQVVLGIERTRILDTLRQLKSNFRFESFEDLGVEGVARHTDLSRENAEQAIQRACTEPLLWHDDIERIADFGESLAASGLSLTRGGRFWHVAGQTNKGQAMRYVAEQWLSPETQSVAIGDSPIDQSMLDLADYPIAIPAPDGVVHVRVDGKNSRVAINPGAAGWADTVSQLLDALNR